MGKIIKQALYQRGTDGNQIKRCSLLDIRKFQVQTKMKYHYKSNMKAQIKNKITVKHRIKKVQRVMMSR